MALISATNKSPGPFVVRASSLASTSTSVAVSGVRWFSRCERLVLAVADPTQRQTEPWRLLTSLQLHRQKEQPAPVLSAPSQRKTMPLEWYHFSPSNACSNRDASCRDYPNRFAIHDMPKGIIVSVAEKGLYTLFVSLLLHFAYVSLTWRRCDAVLRSSPGPAH